MSVVKMIILGWSFVWQWSSL